MNKKQVLFDLRNHLKFLTADEINEVLNDDVLSIEETKHYLIIKFSGNRKLRIWKDGSKAWFLNGKLHKENDQPAVIHANGLIEWCVNGRKIK